VSKPQTPQRQLAEEERRRLELEARGGLDQLVQLLTKTAIDAATDQKVKFTNKKREQLRRQSDILSGAVAELIKILTDHPHAHIREYRLANLFEALGSTAFIASYVIKNKTLDKLRTADATEKRLSKVRKPEVETIIGEEFAKFRKQQPATKGGPWKFANAIYKPVNARLIKELHRKKELSRDAIARYLKKHPYFSKSD